MLMSSAVITAGGNNRHWSGVNLISECLTVSCVVRVWRTLAALREARQSVELHGSAPRRLRLGSLE